MEERMEDFKRKNLEHLPHPILVRCASDPIHRCASDPDAPGMLGNFERKRVKFGCLENRNPPTKTWTLELMYLVGLDFLKEDPNGCGRSRKRMGLSCTFNCAKVDPRNGSWTVIGNWRLMSRHLVASQSYAKMTQIHTKREKLVTLWSFAILPPP